MTDSPEASPQTTKTPLAVVAVAVVALIGFAILVLVEANKKDLNVQEESLTAGSAETLTTLGRYEEAIAVYTELLEKSRSPANFASYTLNRANLKYRLGRYEEALADYETAINLDSIGTLYQARWNKAQTLARLGKVEQAKAEFEAFRDEYGEELPQFSQRALHAMALLEM